MSDDNAVTDAQLDEIEAAWKAAVTPPPALPWRDLELACAAVAGHVPAAARDAIMRAPWDINLLLIEVRRLRALDERP